MKDGKANVGTGIIKKLDQMQHQGHWNYPKQDNIYVLGQNSIWERLVTVSAVQSSKLEGEYKSVKAFVFSFKLEFSNGGFG